MYTLRPVPGNSTPSGRILLGSIRELWVKYRDHDMPFPRGISGPVFVRVILALNCLGRAKLSTTSYRSFIYLAMLSIRVWSDVTSTAREKTIAECSHIYCCCSLDCLCNSSKQYKHQLFLLGKNRVTNQNFRNYQPCPGLRFDFVDGYLMI